MFSDEKVPLMLGPWLVSAEPAKYVNMHQSSCYNLTKLFFVHLTKLIFNSLISFLIPLAQNSHYFKGELGQQIL